ncbi:MAG: lysophospholipid acyltransferase family protein [Chitinophagaceae bacterium]|nr:lysophospholipid acyltransferase family protein [Oligoflexus sp.]
MYLFLSGISSMLSLLSFGALEMLAFCVTFLLFDVLRIRRRLMIRNIGIAFGDQYQPYERIVMARKAFNNFVQTLLETFISRRHPIAADVEVENSAILEEAIAGGEGVYFLLCHMGNWEAMGSFMSRRYRPSHTAMKKIKSKGLNRYIDEMRVRNEMHAIKKSCKGDAVRQMNEILDRGELVGFVMDQARCGEPRLPFFSQDARTNTSLAAIWNKRPAPIIPAYFYRRGFGRHTLVINPPLTLHKSDDLKSDIILNTTLFNGEVEKIVRERPEHYFWFHNRWK